MPSRLLLGQQDAETLKFPLAVLRTPSPLVPGCNHRTARGKITPAIEQKLEECKTAFANNA